MSDVTQRDTACSKVSETHYTSCLQMMHLSDVRLADWDSLVLLVRKELQVQTVRI